MKLQPNFSWQKYEGKPEDQKEQFQFQLQSQHIQVANSVNTTIDDESFWTRQRQTAFTWIDGKAIWTKTITGVIVGTAITSYPHGATNIDKLVRIEGSIQNALPLTTFAFPLPYVDPVTPLNGIGVFAGPVNIDLNVGNNAWAGFVFSATIYYTKT